MHIDKPKSTMSDSILKKKTNVRIVCPNCGNDHDFMEIADGVILTTRYTQNDDGSFSQLDDESEIFGEIRFFCGECNSDLTQYHKHFLEMLF